MVKIFSWLVTVEERIYPDDSTNDCCYLLDLAAGFEKNNKGQIGYSSTHHPLPHYVKAAITARFIQPENGS